MHADSLRARLRPAMRRKPWFRELMDRVEALRFALDAPGHVFDDIHRRNFRKAVEARVRGDAPENGRLPLLLQALIEKYDVQTLLDLPCGDFHWLSRVHLNGCTYIGGDAVTDVVEANAGRYASSSRSFLRIDILRDRLPRAELLLCRDLFVHLSASHIRRAIANIRRCDIRYLLMTQHTRAGTYEEIDTGGWRPIDFRLPPFGFPEPLETLYERGGEFRGAQALGKSLALWRVCDLPG